MSGQRTEFIVLAIGDRDREGYAEGASLRLLLVIDASAPDARVHNHIGVVGFYLPTARAIAAVEDAISSAEELRDSDDTFATLGIGLACGPLLADFDAPDRLNPSFLPVGEVANHASRAVHGAQTYRETLSELHGTKKT